MSQQHSLAVVILAAGSVKQKYKSYSFLYNSPALVPIASRSTLSFILAFYENTDARILVAINKEDEDLFRKELAYYTHVELMTITDSTGVCDTLEQVMQQVREEEVIVNLGTTIPTAPVLQHSAVFDTQPSSHGDYSGMLYEDDQILLHRKSQNGPQTFYAFMGIVRSSRALINKSLSGISNKTDLLELVIALHQQAPLTFSKAEWIDTGHEINYAIARKRLISSRSFNTITVDNYTGILTKRSKNKDKLQHEINYVQMLPKELQILYPRLLSSDHNTGKVEMEYYGYPNLSEYQLYRTLEPLQWARIFDGLYFTLSKKGAHPYSIGKKAFEDFYLNKTWNRIEDFLNSLSPDDLFRTSETITVNGVVCSNVWSIKTAIAQKIDSLYQEEDFCVMHGDFCFNNILYDTVSDTIKLIDPRGSFGELCVGIYGDKKYDLAKLLHSTVGHYDYIVNNLFYYQERANDIRYSFPERENQASLDRLSANLVDKMNMKQENILFIVGLLFLSMCPLHADNKQRQRLMYAHGLSFVNHYIK
ncbi:MAG: hypothetical protein JNL13_12555 [Chitinophagaceae bacterium]|nr:hypothetical protein [Chitinophagaceae bacterium]